MRIVAHLVSLLLLWPLLAPGVTVAWAAPAALPAIPALPATAASAGEIRLSFGKPAAGALSDRELVAGSCLAEILATERELVLPPGLLLAIALAESGRPDRTSGSIIPWAWSVAANGKGVAFDSREEAIREAAAHLAKNQAWVDVGCMQVNLFSHPHAFHNLSEAFDPPSNVSYAGHFLQSLHRARGSWVAAIMAYHSGSVVNAEGLSYVSRVLDLWTQQKIQGRRAAGSADRPALGFVVEESPQPLDVASSLFVAKDYGAALEIYRASLALYPDDPVAALGAAECLRLSGHADQARSLLLRAVAADPDNRATLSALLQSIDQEPAMARQLHLLSARAMAPNSWEILARLALVESEAGDSDQALRDMAQAVSLAPGNPTLLLDQAILVDRVGKPADALTAYQQVLAVRGAADPQLALVMEQARLRARHLQTLAAQQ